MRIAPKLAFLLLLFQACSSGSDSAETTDNAGSQAGIEVPEGFEVQLVAAEPLVMDPVAMDWGADGRLWVVEMADYPLGIAGQSRPGGRVRCLQDVDRDGIYDRSTLWIDHLSTPTGIIAWRQGVLISAAPDILYVEDTDGDGQADHQEVLYTGFNQGNQQHRVNGFCWGLDNWLYLANGDSGGVIVSKKTGQQVDIQGRDVRIRPDEGLIEAIEGQTQFGRSRDDWGNWFGCNNPNPALHYVLADRYLKRNPHFAPPPARRRTSAPWARGRRWRPARHPLPHYWETMRTPRAGTPPQAAPAVAPARDDGAFELCPASDDHSDRCCGGPDRHARGGGGVARAAALVCLSEIRLCRAFGNSCCCRRY